MGSVSRRRIWIGILLVALTAVFIIVSLTRSHRAKGVEVRAEPVRLERIESWVRAPGTVMPVVSLQISSNVTGRISELAVAEGARVRRGDLLLRLDDERYRSTLQGARALVDAARADLDLAEAQRDRSRRHLRRQEELSRDSLVSEETLEGAQTSARIDEARVAVAREELRRREAVLAEAGKDLAETVFRAPIDGIVTALNVEEGENVITGTMNNPGTVILTLADLDNMKVEAEVDETDVVAVESGQSARIMVDAMEASTLEGRVTSVGMSGRRGSQAVQQQVRSFEVHVRILDPPRHLRPGMSADVDILTGARDDALVVPIQALTAHPRRVTEGWASLREKGDSGHNVERTAAEDDTLTASEQADLVEGLFLFREGEAVFVPVTLGLRGDTMIEVEGRIEPGDKVITGPYRELRRLKDAAPVRVRDGGALGRAGGDRAED